MPSSGSGELQQGRPPLLPKASQQEPSLLLPNITLLHHRAPAWKHLLHRASRVVLREVKISRLQSTRAHRRCNQPLSTRRPPSAIAVRRNMTSWQSCWERLHQTSSLLHPPTMRDQICLGVAFNPWVSSKQDRLLIVYRNQKQHCPSKGPSLQMLHPQGTFWMSSWLQLESLSSLHCQLLNSSPSPLRQGLICSRMKIQSWKSF